MKHLLKKVLELGSVIKPYGKAFQLAATSLGFFFFTASIYAQELKPQFQFPLKCKMGENCFLQSHVDLDPGPNVLDPFCGKATYNGHKGVDIRLKSVKETIGNVSVLVAANGVVRGIRNHMQDKLIRTNKDKDAVKGVECGNGVVIDHGNGYESQYCHMKQGSISVQIGEKVKAGQPIGSLGVSGFTEFPHLHFTVRKNGKWVDAVSGLFPDNACASEGIKDSLFTKAALEDLSVNPTQILDAGISGKIIDHDKLVEVGGPLSIKSGDKTIVGWSWFINLKKGDRIHMRLDGPNGKLISNLTEPFDRSKASWSGYVGRKREPKPGEYTYSARVLRGETTVREITKKITVK